MNRRDRIFNRYGGKCAYSGTDLLPDWQIDHVEPVVRMMYSREMHRAHNDYEENMVPCQRIINHYKHSYSLEDFRRTMSTLHLRVDKPKNPRTPKAIKKREYKLQVAAFFGITADKPFNGTFYFESLNKQQHND